MSIDIGIDCEDCYGDMWIYNPPDFNEEGKIDPFCNECGGGFKKHVETVNRTVQTTFVNSLSNHKLGSLLHILRIRSNLPHLKYFEKQQQIQDIRDNCFSRYSLIVYLSNKYKESMDFLESKVSLF